jgi:tetratricopeptide (TPR) repeat protein
MNKAVEYFQKAIDKQPDWAPAYAGQAHAYHELSWYRRPNEVMPKARMSAEKALQLDPADAEAHAALAWVKWVYEWDWAGSEVEFKRALDFRPNSALVRAQFALFLNAAGRTTHALNQEHTALQLDPLSTVNNSNLADILASDGQLDLAIQQYLSIIAKDPHFGAAHADLGATYALRGRFSDAIKEIQTGLLYDPDPKYRGWLAWIYATNGRKQQAREALRALDELSTRQYIPASISAAALAALGDRERAFAGLQKGCPRAGQQPGVLPTRSWPRFSKVRSSLRAPLARLRTSSKVLTPVCCTSAFPFNFQTPPFDLKSRHSLQIALLICVPGANIATCKGRGFRVPSCELRSFLEVTNAASIAVS